MIRGKKNYLPLSQLILGFGFLFKLDEDCVDKHKDERRIRGINDDDMSVTSSVITEQELEIDDDEDDEEKDTEFPDTRIRTISTNDEEGVIIDADEFTDIVKPMEARVRKQKQMKKEQEQKRKETQDHEANKPAEQGAVPNASNQQGQVKRGQKAKLKKMKEKYKDQDEEDRQMMMALLQSAGAQEKAVKDKKSKVSSFG